MEPGYRAQLFCILLRRAGRVLSAGCSQHLLYCFLSHLRGKKSYSFTLFHFVLLYQMYSGLGNEEGTNFAFFKIQMGSN